jgi:hypothetical protein
MIDIDGEVEEFLHSTPTATGVGSLEFTSTGFSLEALKDISVASNL